MSFLHKEQSRLVPVYAGISPYSGQTGPQGKGCCFFLDSRSRGNDTPGLAPGRGVCFIRLKCCEDRVNFCRTEVWASAVGSHLLQAIYFQHFQKKLCPQHEESVSP